MIIKKINFEVQINTSQIMVSEFKDIIQFKSTQNDTK